MPSITRKKGGISTGGFAEKVIALAKYDSRLLTELHMNKANKSIIERSAANLISRYFEAYVDARARANPKSLHHVYEFDSTGNKDSRLFKRTVTPTSNGSVISYKFINAKVPNREGYPFAKKASVMESGETIVITPKRGKYLQYVTKDGAFVKTQKPSIVPNPGGDYVAGSFANEFSNFTATQAKRVLKEFRFFERINSSYKIKRKLTMPKINSLYINSYAQAASDAKTIAMQSGMMMND